MELVDIAEPGALLDTVYTEILNPSFRSDEMTTVESLRGGINDGGKVVTAVVDDGRPVAAAVGEWSPASGILLLAYLAVRGDRRGGGAGGRLLRHGIDSWVPRHGACALLAEIEHPAAHRGSEAYGDPAARLRFYARHGGRALDLPYFQPALRPGLSRVSGLLLTVLALTERGAGRLAGTMAAEPVRTFLTEYFVDTEGEVASDAATTALWHGLDRPDGIPLLSLDDPSVLPGSGRPA